MHGGETWFVRRRSFATFVDPDKHRLDLQPDGQVAPKFLIARLD